MKKRMFSLILVKTVPLRMGEPVFPVAPHGDSFAAGQDLQIIQDRLRQVFLSGGIDRMSEDISEDPDVVKPFETPFRDPDKAF